MILRTSRRLGSLQNLSRSYHADSTAMVGRRQVTHPMMMNMSLQTQNMEVAQEALARREGTGIVKDPPSSVVMTAVAIWQIVANNPACCACPNAS